MKYCGYCGTRLHDDWTLFCGHCGKPLPSGSEHQHCDSPRAALQEGSTTSMQKNATGQLTQASPANGPTRELYEPTPKATPARRIIVLLLLWVIGGIALLMFLVSLVRR